MMTTAQGLSESQVKTLRKRGLGNDVEIKTGRSYLQILAKNLFTPINSIIFILGALLLWLGQINEVFFSAGLIIINTCAGIFQEVRAKRKLDQIALLTRPSATVIRNGREKVVDPAEVVRGDVLVLRPGDQVVVDGVVLDSSGMEINESLLTGEAEPVTKQPGEQILSGSFCAAGSGLYRAEKVGTLSYANQLAKGARAFRVIKTPLQKDTDRVFRLLLLLAIGLGLLTAVISVLKAAPLLVSTQSILVIAGLVPNGLLLMVTATYVVAALRIANRGALVQQVNAVESLSNVDVLCMDKTGTLTTNRLELHDLAPVGLKRERLERLLGDFASSTSANNRTGEALQAALQGKPQLVNDQVTFSSIRQWSALSFDTGVLKGAYVLGAPEALSSHLQVGTVIPDITENWASFGKRVLFFAHSPTVKALHDAAGRPQIPPELWLLGVIGFNEELRADARETLAAFLAEGIQPKIISGDNPQTVAAISRLAGLPADLCDKSISGPEIAGLDVTRFSQVVDETVIFGRITPEQKADIVEALRRRGHYVAMIGDGVNDVLTIRKANLGIAMQSGSQATRNNADMVLLNDSFSALIPAFIEGQRIVGGIQDVMRLFLTRSGAAALLILAAALFGLGFPFAPMQITLLTMFVIGIPSWALALWAHPAEPQKHLLEKVQRFVIPAAMLTSLFAFFVYGTYLVHLASDLSAWSGNLTAGNIAVVREAVGREYEVPLNTPAQVAREGAHMAAQTMLTAFSVFSGLLLVVFAKPPHPILAGGAALSKDKRPAILAVFLLLVFLVVVSIPRLSNYFDILTIPQQEMPFLIGVTVFWAVSLQALWRKWPVRHALHTLGRSVTEKAPL